MRLGLCLGGDRWAGFAWIPVELHYLLRARFSAVWEGSGACTGF